MNSVSTRWLGLVLATVAYFASAPAFAQVVTTSGLRGVVTDDQGAPLPSANVVAVHEPSGTRYGVATRADGRYDLLNLRVGGPYTVTVTYVGFQPSITSDLQLALGQERQLDIQLQAASLGGELVVTAEGNQIINADRTGAQTSFSQEQIGAVPTVNRSISDITRLTPQSTGFNSFAGRNNLYNNISVDGSVFNNVFGLASEVGGQTGQSPISLDAVEQIQVSVAPYDVRQGSFTGAGINVVTRAGTNEFTGSVYNYLKNEDLVSGQIDGEEVIQANFSERQTGFSLGGPLLRNKAFFFVNGELRSRIDPGATFRPFAAAGEQGQAGVANVSQADLEAVQTALQTRFNYNAGTFGINDLAGGADNLTARFDVNLTDNHRFNVRFNYLDSNKAQPTSNSNGSGVRRNSLNAVPFSFTNYTINNDVYSVVGQLNSTFRSNVANQFTVGYTALRDSRTSDSSPFPFIDILNPNNGNQAYIALGYEQFTANNLLNTDVFQIANNTSVFLGRHTLTFGTSNEVYSFQNGFTPQYYGYYRFASVQDFLGHVNAPNPAAAGVPQPIRYQLTYSAVPGVDVPLAEISAAQLGLYVQDEVRVMPNLRVTAGLRVDAPVFLSDLPENAAVAGLTFRDLGGDAERLDVSNLPGFKPLWSPRIGFNYDVLNDKTVQLRGGTGIFTGKIPFVWVSNQASNNGVLFGSTFVTGNGTAPLCQPGTSGATCQPIVLTADRNDYVPANPSAPSSYTVNVTDEDFSFPQVFRTNLAVDTELPGGFIATLEGIYTKDINAVFHRDANLEAPVGTYAGADNRPVFGASSADRRINDNINNAIVLDNTSQGYQTFVTADLQKTFSAGVLDGLFTRLAYTRGVSKDLTSSPSAIAFTAWSGNQSVNGPNDPELAYSSYDQRDRVLGIAQYRLDYLGLAGTTLSATYTGGTGFNYSYVYGGDMNRDGISQNDLIYIPRDRSEIVISPASSDTRTADQIWNELDAFIAQDPYLSSRRGQYAERGAATTPWINRLDIGLRQEIAVPTGTGRRARLEITADVINFANLLNSSWGVVETPNTTAPITFRNVQTVNGELVPTFTSNAPAESFGTDTGLSSRWQALFGVRFAL